MNLAKKSIIVLVSAFAIALLVFSISVIIKVPSFQETPLKNGKSGEVSQIGNMKLMSSSFEDNGEIPSKYTCDGENISPAFDISQVPEGVQSLTLIVDDPDAPTGDWVHWLVWNINPELTEIIEGEIPEGAIQGLNDFGNSNYGGPCPPTGTHRYQFKLYALDTTINLSSLTKKVGLEEAIRGKVLDETMLVGLYTRK